MDVIKLGGSLCQPEWMPFLLDWLEARLRLAPFVLVCGGGVHADAVRSEQQRLGYDDLTAHRQALLAMEQTAWFVAAAWTARHGRKIAVGGEAAEGSVWVPRALLDDSRIAASWSITSDSLAAWYAGQISAERLLVLKALPWAQAPGGPDDWAAHAWVDPAFPAYVRAAGCRAALLGQASWKTVPADLP